MTTFQTPADKDREHAVAAEVSAAWKCQAVEFPALSPIDWYLHRGPKLVALVEIKTRDRTLRQFSTLFLDGLKFWSLQLGSIAFGVPSLFVVGCHDGIFFVKVDAAIGATVSVRGRQDRGHAGDVHPCFEIPVDRFRPLKGGQANG